MQLEMILAQIVDAPGPIPDEGHQSLYIDHLLHTLQAEGSSRAWDICTGRSGITLMSGVRGHHLPAPDFYTTTSPTVNGAREHGYRIQSREVYLPLEMWLPDEGTDDWLALYRNFFSDISFRNIVWWQITHPRTGEFRRLPIRFRPDGNQAFDQAPELGRFATFDLYAMAHQPEWQGEPFTRAWGESSAKTFLEDGNINIGEAQPIDEATAVNLGDEPAAIQVRLEGPRDAGFVISVDGRTIRLRQALTDGQVVNVDTSDEHPGVFTDDGTNVTRQMVDVWDSVMVPPHSESRVRFIGPGKGPVSLSLTPLFDDGFPTIKVMQEAANG